MTKAEEQRAFEDFAKQVGDLVTNAENILDFTVEDIPDEARREAWEEFVNEWDDHVDELHNAVRALMDAGYTAQGGAKWLA
jgi:hypothetical protein